MPIPKTKHIPTLIRFLMKEGKPQKQAIAIAHKIVGKKKKKRKHG